MYIYVYSIHISLVGYWRDLWSLLTYFFFIFLITKSIIISFTTQNNQSHFHCSCRNTTEVCAIRKGHQLELFIETLQRFSPLRLCAGSEVMQRIHSVICDSLSTRSKFPIVRDHRVCRNNLATCIDRWRAGLPCNYGVMQTDILKEGDFWGIRRYHSSWWPIQKRLAFAKKQLSSYLCVFSRNDFIIPIHGENPYTYTYKGHHAHPPAFKHNTNQAYEARLSNSFMPKNLGFFEGLGP